MPNPWFRFYSETLRDRKLERIARVTGQPRALIIGVWVTILSLANDSPILRDRKATHRSSSATDEAANVMLDIMEKLAYNVSAELGWRPGAMTANREETNVIKS